MESDRVDRGQRDVAPFETGSQSDSVQQRKRERQFSAGCCKKAKKATFAMRIVGRCAHSLGPVDCSGKGEGADTEAAVDDAVGRKRG